MGDQAVCVRGMYLVRSDKQMNDNDDFRPLGAKSLVTASSTPLPLPPFTALLLQSRTDRSVRLGATRSEGKKDKALYLRLAPPLAISLIWSVAQL